MADLNLSPAKQVNTTDKQMLLNWVPAVITDIKDETQNTRRFFFEVPSVESFDFEPGQFVTFDLPIHELKNKRWRSYSIASAPDGTNRFELVIVLLEGGLGTEWLWANATVGTELIMRGPQGKFTLPDPIEKDLYFICTGTGIAPFRAMVHHIRKHNVPHQNIYLIFGCRKFGDALYLRELQDLANEMENFYFIPTFSRESADNHLLMRTGYVHQVYEEFVKQRMIMNGATSAESALPPAAFYLCGWKNMIDEARQRIAVLGYDKKAVHLELYG